MASDKQRIRFFRLWSGAKAEVCERYGLCALVKDGEREARHKWVMECTGRTENIGAVRPGNEFSRLMLRTALAAGDYREAAFWELDVAKRWRWFMGNLVRQLGEIARTGLPWEYVQGIFAHMRLPRSWQDIPEGELEKVWQMLDTHRRRLLKRDHGWKGLRREGANPLGFFPEAEYCYRGDGRLGIRWPEKVRAEDAENAKVAAREAVTA